jgi:hypothetical protein
MDPECIALCEAMNKFDGIETIESCCGHGDHPYRIWFVARDLQVLPELLYWFDACHTGRRGWNVSVQTDCSMAPAVFKAEGPVGKQSYTDALFIAEKMAEYLISKNDEPDPARAWDITSEEQ